MTISTKALAVRRAVLAVLMLAVTAIGVTLAAATPATAAPAAEDRAPSPSIPAIPGVPDVGLPGEGVGGRDVPTIDPQGRRVPSHAREGTVSTLASGYTWADIIANGARIRSYPVTGTVIGLAYYGQDFLVSCKRRGSDGYLWGYGYVASRRCWVREDLWDVTYFTYPGAPAPRPIPYC